MTNYSRFIVGKGWKEIFRNLDPIDKQIIINALKQHKLSNDENLRTLAKDYIEEFEI